MVTRVVVVLVEEPVDLRQLAIRLRLAEQQEDMEAFRAHLRESGEVVLVAKRMEVHEIEYKRILQAPHGFNEELGRRMFHRSPVPAFRDLEFRSGRRSSLMRSANAPRKTRRR